MPISRRQCVANAQAARRRVGFRAAAVDPSTRLALDACEVETPGTHFEKKRDALRCLAFDRPDGDAPLHVIGPQRHQTPIDLDGVSDVPAEMRKDGLDVCVTELDAIDLDLPASPAERNAIPARPVADLLESVSAPASPGAPPTRNLSDRLILHRTHRRAESARRNGRCGSTPNCNPNPSRRRLSNSLAPLPHEGAPPRLR